MTVTPTIGNSGIALGVALLLVNSNNATALDYQWQNHALELGGRARLAKVEAEENARAASLLIRFGLMSEWSSQFKTLVEVDHVELAWENEFSNGVNFNGTPVIPDVAGTDLNQALISYAPTNSLEFLLGREAVVVGNQRFIGTNGFWQNEQTLDIAGFKLDFASASEISYRYVDNANRINGDDADKRLNPERSPFEAALANANNGKRPAKFLGDHDHDSHLLFAKFKEWDYTELQAYYFDMNIEDAEPLSNKTLGLRYEYRGRLNRLRALAFAEWATQERSEVNADANLQYQNVGAGLGYRSHQLSLHYERLSEDNGISFVTPLASLHDENGWADKFLVTPVSGLQDYSLQYIWRNSPIKIDTRYHVFNADDNHRTLGNELDIDIEFTLAKNHILLVRYADFSAKDPGLSDEKRAFIMYSHNL